MERDYYEVLGIQRDADPATIKHAYRTHSRVLHPDASGDPESEARFRELSEAYAVLSRPEARRLYDGLGWRRRGRGFERRPAYAYHSNKRRLLEDLESLIVSAQGGRPEREPTRVVASIEVGAYEAYLGATRRVELGEERPCDTCEGSGRRSAVSRRDSGRFLSFDACDVCGGTGVAEEWRRVDVSVPPGARDSDVVAVGAGEVAIIRIVPPREHAVVRAAALAGLVVALGFLLFLLAL